MHSNAQHVCELFFIQHIIWFTIINLIAGETYVHVRHVDVISCQIFLFCVTVKVYLKTQLENTSSDTEPLRNLLDFF